MKEQLPRKLSAILHADLVGYSRHTGEDEEGTYQRLRNCLSTADECVASYNGTICNYAGDAILADFSSAVSALNCAVHMQQKFDQCNLDIPESRDLEFRIGLNLGEVIVDGEEIFGDSVNIAARLQALAEPGGICISKKLWEEVNSRVDYQFADKGEISVKNIDKPINVFQVVMGGTKNNNLDRPVKTASSTPALKPSIAILPLTNMSGDSEQEYFSDGLTEDIITGLSRFRSVNVIARNSTFVYKGKAVMVRAVGQELGADYVVEGSVRRAGDRVRITVQLINARDDNHVWAQKYDRVLDDIFAVQDEVVQSILSALPEHVEAADLEKGKRKSTAQMDAYDYFLKGRELHHKFNREDCQEGIRHLEKAVELDPDYAQAWAWLSCTIGQAWVRGYLPDAKSLWVRCVNASKRSLELDEEDSECHRLMSEIYLYQNKHEQAHRHNERGLSLNPNNPRLIVQRGYLLVYTGRPDEGIEWVEKVIQLDPMHPENYYSHLAVAMHAAHRYEGAIEVFNHIPQLLATQYAYLISCHSHLSNLEEVSQYKRLLLELDPTFSISQFERTLHYKRDEDKSHLLETLRGSGLPD